MEIVSTTSSYISSISAAYKKAYNNTGKVGSKLSISSKESMTNDPLAYYKQLCSKYPNISFRLDDYFNGTNAKGYNLGYNNSMNQVGENFGEMGQCSIEIDISVIEKMMQDPKYEQQANGWIQAFEQNYAGHAADVASSGCSNFCFTIHDFGDGIQTGRTCGYTPFSTEEEVRKMWADEEYQKSVSQVFDKQKADLIEIYLKMTESCILKKDEIAPSEQIKEEHRVTYHHYTQPDVVIQGYKVGEENGIPRYRYITTQHGKTISDVTINPETVDPRNATTEEMLALNVYLLEKGVIDEDMQILGSFSEYSGNGRKVNFYEASSEYMQMQYDVGNLSSYMIYRKSLDALAEIINKIDSYKE